MLTREHALAEFDYRRGIVIPDRLTRAAHAHYIPLAEQMLRIYREGTGRLRRDLHRQVDALFEHEDDCPLRRVKAFCKLLDDAAEYDLDSSGKAAELRQRVFRLAAPRHPLRRTRSDQIPGGERTVKREIGEELQTTWSAIEASLFSDVIEFQRMLTFTGYSSASAFLSRYNVAQVQVALFDAIQLTVWAREDFKTILRYAKLARLMHSILLLPDGTHQFRFDGPASILRETRRYGSAFARFLPGLLACRNWKLHAVMSTPRAGWSLALDLADTDGLRSHVPPPSDFDSEIEEQFADRWDSKPRDGWMLIREGEVLHSGQKVFVPDFTLKHPDGRKAFLEIIGFWTPEYLANKREVLRTFADVPIVLAVANSVLHSLADLPANIVVYKTRLSVDEVLAAVAKTAASLDSAAKSG